MNEVRGSTIFAGSSLQTGERAPSRRLILRVADLKTHFFARALAVAPDLVIGDEPVSALEVSILNLLARLRDFNLTMMFISLDLSVVDILADRVMEIARTAELFAWPHHPYTRALLSAGPGRRKDGEALLIPEGDEPSPIDPPSGRVVRRPPLHCRNAPPRRRFVPSARAMPLPASATTSTESR
jgi:oligopeptide/dipeptide ABC transporter ATP-binding protein